MTYFYSKNPFSQTTGAGDTYSSGGYVPSTACPDDYTFKGQCVPIYRDYNIEFKQIITKETTVTEKKFDITDEIKDVIYSGTMTIVLWKDGTKTEVKPNEHDEFDPEVGLAMAITQKLFGSRNKFCKMVDSAVIRANKRKPTRKEIMRWFYVWRPGLFSLSADNLVFANKASEAAQMMKGAIKGEEVRVVSKDDFEKYHDPFEPVDYSWLDKHCTIFIIK